MPMYRVGVYGDGKLVSKMLSQPKFLPTNVLARFVGVPVDTVEHLKRACKEMGYDLELSSGEARYYLEYKPQMEMLEKYNRYDS